MIFEIVIILFGLILFFLGRQGVKDPTIEVKLLGKEWWALFWKNLREAWENWGYRILLSGFIVLLILFFINVLSLPDMPLYSFREAVLKDLYPNVAVEDLPEKSSFTPRDVAVDIIILVLFLYAIVIPIRPGQQIFEDIIGNALSRGRFSSILMITSCLHFVGHLPLEIYGRKQWGTGYRTFDAWFGFDKITHYLCSIIIIMLILLLIVRYFRMIDIEPDKRPVIIAITALAFMMLTGVIWEFFEWVTMLFLRNMDQFEDEVKDAPKDLVWDFLGALSGIFLFYFETIRKHLGKLIKGG